MTTTIRLTQKKQEELYANAARRLQGMYERSSLVGRVDGWAKERREWGEDIRHQTRGATSPLGGKATQVKQRKE